MQFIPSTWKAYGVDANADGRKDPYNPVDAICAAARYLRAAGGDEDLRTAIFAYNHADWYVDEVLLYARSYGKLPQDLLSSLTGLTEGAHFPVAADARYADDISTREALRRAKPQQRGRLRKRGGGRRLLADTARDQHLQPPRRADRRRQRRRHQGDRRVAAARQVHRAAGRLGNRFTYAQLGQVVRVHPVPKPHKLTPADFKLISPPDDAKPNGPATRTRRRTTRRAPRPHRRAHRLPRRPSRGPPTAAKIKPIQVHVQEGP